ARSLLGAVYRVYGVLDLEPKGIFCQVDETATKRQVVPHPPNCERALPSALSTKQSSVMEQLTPCRRFRPSKNVKNATRKRVVDFCNDCQQKPISAKTRYLHRKSDAILCPVRFLLLECVFEFIADAKIASINAISHPIFCTAIFEKSHGRLLQIRYRFQENRGTYDRNRLRF
ncbi:MAG: hypothetical protein MJA29_10745, partial [Candidatus Omnitrophica bacterium]|nr:hypothetical protein [Candidatus Omnitrophota bacterium]